MLIGTTLPNPDDEYRLNSYEMSSATALATGVPLRTLIGDHIDDLAEMQVVGSGLRRDAIRGVASLPADGWRLLAGTVPPSVDERRAGPPWPPMPECALAAPWPGNEPEWMILHLGRRVERLPTDTIYGYPHVHPRTVYGAHWRSELVVCRDQLQPGRARRRRGLDLAFVDSEVRVPVGVAPSIRVRLTNRRTDPWLNRAPEWEHDTDGVHGLVATPDGRVLSEEWPAGAGMGVERLPDLEPGGSVDLRVTFMATRLAELPPGEYLLLAELTSLHLTAPPVPLTIS